MGLQSCRLVRVPMLTLSTAKSTNSGHVNSRTGPQSNGRRWPGLMNHFFFYITWMVGCVFVTYQGNTWHRDALWEDGKSTEAMWSCGQCSAGKSGVLPSLWMLFWHIPPAWALLQTMYPLSWKCYALMSVASFSRLMRCATKQKMVQKWFEEHRNKFEVLTWPPNSPDLNPIEHLRDVLDKPVWSMEAQPRTLQDLRICFLHLCARYHSVPSGV